MAFSSREGIYAYNKFSTTIGLKNYIEKYLGRLVNGKQFEQEQVSLTGRIMVKRKFKKYTPYDLHGEETVQLKVETRNLSALKHGDIFLSAVKHGDIFGVIGFRAKGNLGEFILNVELLEQFASCLHQIQDFPKKLTELLRGSLRDLNKYSLKQEAWLRKRFLDLILNKDVRKILEIYSKILSYTRSFLDKVECQEVMEPQNTCLSSSVLSSFRIVIVGDIHEDWELEHDYKALQHLQPNLVLFTGDFGNENVELVKGIAGLNMPKAAILGNHDSWYTSKFSKKIKDGVQIQLECLGEQHVGYSHQNFPALQVSVVGGRPFSVGGNQLFRKKLLTSRYGVHNMEESSDKIHKAAVETPEEHSIIFLSHNGPTGLGSHVDDICGKDWVCEGGDHGDPDLAQAISLVKETTNYHIPLVVFGHLHKELANGGSRKMISIDGDNTMYLNAAIVPRVKYPSSGGSVRAFTVVEFEDGKITKVAETWVSVIDDKTLLGEQHILFSSLNDVIHMS